MRIDVFTLFPEWFGWFATQRHVDNALKDGDELRPVDYRASTPLTGRQVDDAPYGGGAGMVMRVDVVDAALEATYGPDRSQVRLCTLEPGGRLLDEALVSELAAESHLGLLCGRSEGFDQRVRDHLCAEAISIGRYVLAGGELAAMVVADAVLRKRPGALGHPDSAMEESYSDALEGRPEYPHYTRPPDYRGWEVPEVLRSGDHGRIQRWREEQSRQREETQQAGEKKD
ncbi:MAG: tRNA (guanosine(37)-N1)-methyltransferase TrmD [Solirubrobacterales bacterium]